MELTQEINVYVRFCETDAAGHVNSASYFFYMEEARLKFFDAIGFGRGHRSGLDFIVASTQCDFIAQTYAGQNLRVSTVVSRVGHRSFMLTHEMNNADTGERVALGNAIIACFNFQSQETVAIPPELRQALEQHLIAV